MSVSSFSLAMGTAARRMAKSSRLRGRNDTDEQPEADRGKDRGRLGVFGLSAKVHSLKKRGRPMGLLGSAWRAGEVTAWASANGKVHVRMYFLHCLDGTSLPPTLRLKDLLSIGSPLLHE